MNKVGQRQRVVDSFEAPLSTREAQKKVLVNYAI